MSDKTIYNYVHFHIRGELKKLALKDLRLKVKKRKSANKDEKRGKLKDIPSLTKDLLKLTQEKLQGTGKEIFLLGKTTNQQSA